MGQPKAVRLMPANKRRGYTVQSFTHKGQRYLGGERPRWYLVDAGLADELVPMRQDPADEHSPPLFEVVTQDEQQTIESRENTQYLVQLGVLQGAVTVPRDVQSNRVEDLRAPQVDETYEPAGRAAAAAPPRTPTREKIEVAEVKRAEPVSKPVAVEAEITPDPSPDDFAPESSLGGSIKTSDVPRHTSRGKKRRG